METETARRLRCYVHVRSRGPPSSLLRARLDIGTWRVDAARVLVPFAPGTWPEKRNLFVAIDGTSKFAALRLERRAGDMQASRFLRDLVQAVPCRIHTILTDNGIQFAEQPRNRNTAHSRPMRFDMIFNANGIELRLTKPNHLWTNGQFKRIN